MKPSPPTPPGSTSAAAAREDTERHGMVPPAPTFDGRYGRPSTFPPSRSTPVPLRDGTTAVSLDFLMRNARLSRQDHTKVLLELLLDLQWAYAQSSSRVERRALGVVCPANTLVTTDGRVRLPRPTGEALRQPPHYAAPERTSDTPPAMPHDIHAVGVMLLELLAGRVLDSNEVRNLVPHSVASAPAWQPHLHDPLLTVALRAIAATPEHRWSSAGEMAQALGRRAAELVSDRASLAELVRVELERDELLALHGVTGPIPPEDLEQVDAVRVSGFHAYADRRSGDDWATDGTTCESPWDDAKRTG